MAPYAVHRSIRGNYPRPGLVLLLLLLIVAPCCAIVSATIMGEQCDWTAK